VKLQLGSDKERAELIAICELATVPEIKWCDRDSYATQKQVGECWALLRAGCDFVIHGADGDPPSDEKTIWATTFAEGFMRFEMGPEVGKADDLFYLPTRKRLDESNGGDWY